MDHAFAAWDGAEQTKLARYQPEIIKHQAKMKILGRVTRKGSSAVTDNQCFQASRDAYARVYATDFADVAAAGAALVAGHAASVERESIDRSDEKAKMEAFAKLEKAIVTLHGRIGVDATARGFPECRTIAMGYIADCFEICPANGRPSMDAWLDTATGSHNRHKRELHEEFGDQFYSACAAVMSYLTPTVVCLTRTVTPAHVH